MERKLTINNSVCGRWFLCLIALFLMSVGMQAENYGITVAGVEVTDANAGNVLGDNITAGTVSFNPQTNTLTLNNVSMNGNVVSSIDNLNVKLVGVSTFNIDNSDWIPRVGAWVIDALSQMKCLPMEYKTYAKRR